MINILPVVQIVRVANLSGHKEIWRVLRL